MTLQDIGAHFGVSRERARQIEAALIDRMREYRPLGDPGLRPRRRAGALRPDRYSGRIVRLSKCTFDSHPESAK